MKRNLLGNYLVLAVGIIVLTISLTKRGPILLAQSSLVENSTRVSNASSRAIGEPIEDSITRDIFQYIAKAEISQNAIIEKGPLPATPIVSGGHQPASENAVKYSPNGRYIALLEYVNENNYETNLVIINEIDGIVERIVQGSSDGFPSNPLWSPDSNYLAYVWYEPKTASISLWIVNILDFSVTRLETGTTFWPVLVYGITDAVIWEPDSSALQYLDERVGKVFRVELAGSHSEIDLFDSLIPPALVTGMSLNALTYSGMVKPLNVRDYDGTCWNGYPGLYPTYTCTSSASHPAVDMAGGATQIGCGTPVVAVCDGIIVRTETYGLGNYSACGNNVGNPVQGFANLGWQVTLRCDNIPNASLAGTNYGGTIYVTYAHLSEIQAGIASNVAVSRGQLLGKVGSTGYSEAPHLHFQMDKDNSPYHPYYPSPYPVSLVLERTWNPMYFIKAHEKSSCCGCALASSAGSSSNLREFFPLIGPVMEYSQVFVNPGDEEFVSSLTPYTEMDEEVGDNPKETNSNDLDNWKYTSESGIESQSVQASIREDIESGLPSSSVNYQLIRSVMGMGGGTKTSSSYILRGTSGQPFATGSLASSSYRLNSGYWGMSASTSPPTITPTATATRTVTITPSPTGTIIYTPTPTLTGTFAWTPTPTNTSTPTLTPIPGLNYRLNLPVIIAK